MKSFVAGEAVQNVWLYENFLVNYCNADTGFHYQYSGCPYPFQRPL